MEKLTSKEISILIAALDDSCEYLQGLINSCVQLDDITEINEIIKENKILKQKIIGVEIAI